MGDGNTNGMAVDYHYQLELPLELNNGEAGLNAE